MPDSASASPPRRWRLIGAGLFLAGALSGGLVGGVAGYVINDLTSKENPEVMAEIEEEQQVQEDLEAFLNELGQAPPPAGSADTP